MTDDDQQSEVPDDRLGLEDHPLTAGRLAKHREMLASRAYPYRFDRTHTAKSLREAHPDIEPATETDHEVTVAGRIMLLRSFGKLMFVSLQDATGQIQLFVDRRSVGDGAFERFEEFDLGDWLGATGTVMTTKKGELSVRVTDATLLQKSLRPLPDKYHGLQDVELRSRRRYVDLIANEEARTIALARAAIVSEFRRQFEARGYVEVETPVLLNQATGALARPFETHHEALDQPMVLRIATELYLKRLIVGGLEKVFEVGRIFRNEGIDATHNPEFTMLESYEAYADYRDIMTMLEDMIASVAVKVAGSTTVTYEGREVNLAAPFRRARMIDLVSEAVGRDVTFKMPLDELGAIAREHGVEVDDGWGHGKFIDTLFEALVADDIWEPTYVLDHPK
ncbi:MAG: lysine--tRNA ligase, partial [Acidimicrobiia bacterium]|nr:lysine--tRNA ligase [Acidimicrobiia bacterium]